MSDSNAMEFDMPDTLPQAMWLEDIGSFHMNVVEVDPEPRDRNEALIEGFEVTFEVLDGTARANGVCSQLGRSFRHTFKNPSGAVSEDINRFRLGERAALLSRRARPSWAKRERRST